jgi:hypothetical protein
MMKGPWPIPERSETRGRHHIATVESLKVPDRDRPIREADIELVPPLVLYPAGCPRFAHAGARRIH